MVDLHLSVLIKIFKEKRIEENLEVNTEKKNGVLWDKRRILKINWIYKKKKVGFCEIIYGFEYH